MEERVLLERITVSPAIFARKPIVRGRRLAVEHVLAMLAAGDAFETLLEGYLWLEPHDIEACLLYAARVVGSERVELTITLRVKLEERSHVLKLLDRIPVDPVVMGGKPCIRGMRVTVATIVGLLAAGRTEEAILAAYPYLEADDIKAALAYAAWRLEESEVPLTTS